MFRKFLILSGFLLSFWSHPGAALEFADTKAVLSRGANTKIRLSFSLTNISPADRTTYGLKTGVLSQEDGIFMLTRYLDICIFAASDTTRKCAEGTNPLKVTYTANSNLDTTPAVQRDSNYTASFVDGSTNFVIQDQDATFSDMSTLIELNAVGTTAFNENTYIALRLLPGTTTSSNFKETEAKVTPSVAANDVVSSLEIRPSKGTLTAIWDKNELIDMQDGSQSKADGAIAFVLPATAWNSDVIPLRSYDAANPNKETDVLTNACRVTDTGDSCTLDCVKPDKTPILDPELYYLKVDDLKAAGLQVFESGNTGSISINGLQNDTRYALIYQNQPDGLQQACRIAQPSEAITLSELSGGKEPVLKDPRCFIATAAYGSALDPHLNSLRWFRDRVLLATDLGKTLVQTYYRLSPPVADYIASQPTLRTLVRAGLWLPVILIETWRDRPSILITLSAMSATFFLLFLRRRSLRASV